MKIWHLTLIWMGFLVVPFEVRMGKTTPTPPPSPCLKRVRNMLETSNLARKCKPYVVSELRSLYSGLCSKLAKNLKNDNDVTIFRHDINVNFFLTSFCFSCQV